MKENKKIEKSTIVADVSAAFAGETYVNIRSQRTVPVTMEYIAMLAQELVKFGDKADSIKMAQFYNPLGIERKTFYDWVARYENLRSSYLHARESIGIRREINIINKAGDYNSAPTMYMMHKYDPEWDEADRRWTDLKKPEAVVVDMQGMIETAKAMLVPYPKSDQVPDKPTPEEVAGKLHRSTMINDRLKNKFI